MGDGKARQLPWGEPNQLSGVARVGSPTVEAALPVDLLADALRPDEGLGSPSVHLFAGSRDDGAIRTRLASATLQPRRQRLLALRFSVRNSHAPGCDSAPIGGGS